MIKIHHWSGFIFTWYNIKVVRYKKKPISCKLLSDALFIARLLLFFDEYQNFVKNTYIKITIQLLFILFLLVLLWNHNAKSYSMCKTPDAIKDTLKTFWLEQGKESHQIWPKHICWARKSWIFIRKQNLSSVLWNVDQISGISHYY